MESNPRQLVEEQECYPSLTLLSSSLKDLQGQFRQRWQRRSISPRDVGNPGDVVPSTAATTTSAARRARAPETDAGRGEQQAADDVVGAERLLGLRHLLLQEDVGRRRCRRRHRFQERSVKKIERNVFSQQERKK